MNLSSRLLFLTIPLAFCSLASGMGGAPCQMESTELTPKFLPRKLELIVQNAKELAQVLDLDKQYYNISIFERRGGEEHTRQLMAEYVAHMYLVPATAKLLALVERLAHQEQADPELVNLQGAVDSIAPLKLKYVKRVYEKNDGNEWTQYEELNPAPVHPKARSKPLGSQANLIQCSTTDYQITMQSLLTAYHQEKLEAKNTQKAPTSPFILSEDH